MYTTVGWISARGHFSLSGSHEYAAAVLNQECSIEKKHILKITICNDVFALFFHVRLILRCSWYQYLDQKFLSHNFLHIFFQTYETHLMKRDSSHCGSGDPLAPFGNALKSFFVFKLFLVLSFLISLVTLAVTLINAIQQNRCKIFGFFSPLVPSKREKNVLVLLSCFAQFVYSLREVCLFFNFWMIRLKSKHTYLKKYANWAKLIYFSLVLREHEDKKGIIFRTFFKSQFFLVIFTSLDYLFVDHVNLERIHDKLLKGFENKIVKR